MGWIRTTANRWISGIPAPLRSEHALLFYIYLLSLSVYLVNGRSVAFVDTGPARHLALSLIRERDLDLNEVRPHIDVLELGYTTREIDGNLVSYYPVGTAFLAVPFYAAGMLIGLEADQLDGLAKLEKWAAANLGALLAVLYWILLNRRTSASLSVRLLLWLAVTFGTSNWVVNSQGLWQHTPMQIFVILALLAIPRNLLDSSFPWARLALGGFCLALAGFMRPTAFILLPVWGGLILLRQWRLILPFAAGAIIGILPQVLYNLTYITDTQGGYFNLIFKGGFFRELSPVDNCLSLLISPSRGFLVFSPFALLLVLWLLPEVRQHRIIAIPRVLLLLSALSLFCIYLSFQIWWAGWTYGARFLSDLLPFLMLLMVPPLQYLLSRSRLIALASGLLVTALVGWSIYVQALGAWRYDGGWDSDVAVTLYQDNAWDWSRNTISYCVTGGENPYEKVNNPAYYRIDPLRIYRVGMRESAQFLRAGFHTQEGWGTWTRGVLPATLYFNLPEGAGKLYINALGTGSDYDPARYDFYLNGHHVDKELVHPNAFIDWEKETLEIPLKGKYLTGKIEELVIVSRNPRRAAPTGRIYGLGLKEMLYVPDSLAGEASTTTILQLQEIK